MYNESTEFDVSKHGRYPSPDAKPQWNVATGTQTGYYPMWIMGSARLPMEAPPQNGASGQTQSNGFSRPKM